MYDVAITLEDRPGALAELGEALGKAGISIEGGGVFVEGGAGIAHFLFADGEATANALEEAGIEVGGYEKVLVQKLNQEQPGQLGKLTRLMAAANVNIKVMYSDHDHQLILVVDDYEAGKRVSDRWQRESSTR